MVNTAIETNGHLMLLRSKRAMQSPVRAVTAALSIASAVACADVQQALPLRTHAGTVTAALDSTLGRRFTALYPYLTGTGSEPGQYRRVGKTANADGGDWTTITYVDSLLGTEYVRQRVIIERCPRVEPAVIALLDYDQKRLLVSPDRSGVVIGHAPLSRNDRVVFTSLPCPHTAVPALPPAFVRYAQHEQHI